MGGIFCLTVASLISILPFGLSIVAAIGFGSIPIYLSMFAQEGTKIAP